MIDFREKITISSDGTQVSNVFELTNDPNGFDIVNFGVLISAYVAGQIDIVPQVSFDKFNWIDRAAISPLTANGLTEWSEEQPLTYLRFEITSSGGADLTLELQANTATGPAKINTYNEGSATVLVANTAVPLSATPQPFRTLDVQASPGNTGDIMIGGAGVLGDGSNGVNLTNYGTRHYENGDLSKIYINAPNANDKANFAYET